MRPSPPALRWLRRRAERAPRRLAIGLPYAWLLIFFLAPFVMVLKISFAEPDLAMPPYTSIFDLAEDAGVYFSIKLNLGNYVLLIADDLYWRAYLNSLKIAAISTALTLLIGFPIAYAMARAPTRWRGILVMMMILPFWTSFLIRVYAWIGILKSEGLLNGLLQWLGLIDHPLAVLNTDIAVYIGIVYSYLPFMILPLYANLEKHDRTLLEAAADLGARPWKSFLRITLPLSMPGIIAGALLVFIPAVGEYVIPSLLGRSDQLMIGRVLSDEFFENRDWPVASAVAIAMLLLLVVPIVIFQRHQGRELVHK